MVSIAKTPQVDQPRLLQLSDLIDSNAFFDNLVDMIPQKLYIAGHSGDDYNPKYFKGQAKESREARRSQQKAQKRAKFDPALRETTVQMKKRLEGEKTASSNNLLPQKNHSEIKPPTKGADTGNSSKDNDAAENELAPLIPKDNKSRIEALRAKLHAKIAARGGNRPTDPTVVSKRAARRAEKQRRKDEAIKRKKNASSSKVDGRSTQTTSYTMGAGSKAGSAAQDLAQMDFGRLTGLNPTAATYKNNKALANLGKGKNLEKILADAEQKKAQLEELKRSSKAEDKEKLQKIQWSDALKEASGERVKDDPAKIKNKLKRKAAKKAKSQKAWKSRTDQTQQKIDERQKIRSHNLEKRRIGGKAGSNLSSKRIEDDSAKDGNRDSRRLARPGFEGKKQGFLNAAKQQ